MHFRGLSHRLRIVPTLQGLPARLRACPTLSRQQTISVVERATAPRNAVTIRSGHRGSTHLLETAWLWFFLAHPLEVTLHVVLNEAGGQAQKLHVAYLALHGRSPSAIVLIDPRNTPGVCIA